MMRVSIAERARLSVLIGRRAFRSVVGRISAHPLLRWRFGSAKTDRLVIAPQDLRTADATRASEIYAGRFRLRRQGGDLRPPLAVRDDAAVRRMGGDAAQLRLAAPSARRRQRHHPRQCARADRRLDQPAGRLASARLARRYPVAPHRLLAQPGAVRPAGRRRALLPPLPAQPDAAGALSAPLAEAIARRTAAAAGGDRAQLCDAVHAGPVRQAARQCAPADRGAAHARSCPTAAISAAIPAR